MFVECSHEKVSIVNSESNTKYSKCILCNPLDRYENVMPSMQLDLRNIVGYDDIKKIIQRIVDNFTINPIHLLLGGDPSTAKTVFLQTLLKNLKAFRINAHYINAESMTSAGVIDYLFTHDVEFLLLDELDKLDKSHQKTFLNLLENGVLQETKFKKTRKKIMETFTCIATANYLNKILEPLLTRFMVLYLKAYTQEEFYLIGMILLQYKYKVEEKLSYYIVDQVWNVFMNFRHEYPVIREVARIGKLAGNDRVVVDEILAGLKNRSTKYEKIPN